MWPASRLLTLRPYKASGLLCNSASMACCTVTLLLGRTCAATAQAVSVRGVGPLPSVAVLTAGAVGRGAALGALPGDGAGTLGLSVGGTAGAAAAGAGEGGALIAGAATGTGLLLAPNTGGSSNTVYSRNRRPAGHCSCTMKSRKGARTGWVEVTLTTAVPLPLGVTVYVRSPNTAGQSMPA